MVVLKSDIRQGTLLLSYYPNRSLSWSGCKRMLGLILIPSVISASWFVSLGAWPVVPFIGLEMLVLLIAFYATSRACHSSEHLELSRDRCRYTRRVGRSMSRQQFTGNPHRLLISGCAETRSARRILLAATHPRVEFAASASEAEKRSLAGWLDCYRRGARLPARGWRIPRPDTRTWEN